MIYTLTSMSFLPSLLAFLENSKYVLIFIGTFVEGSSVMMATGLLWHLGTVEFWPAYLALFLGDILSDVMWYFVGYYGARPFISRWGHYIDMTHDVVEKVERRFHRYHEKILIASKLTMGFGFLAIPILTIAGMLRVPFSHYLAINTAGSFIWIAFLMIVGSYFGNVLDYIPQDFQIAIAIATPFLFFFALRGVNRRLKALDW